jgi:outer membrane protein assembly factor BamB
MRHFKVALILLIILSLVGCLQTVPQRSKFTLATSRENIIKKAVVASKPLWKLPLNNSLIEQAYPLGSNRLLIKLVGYDTQFSYQGYLLVDLDNGKILWRQNIASDSVIYRVVLALPRTILLANEDKNDRQLIAVDPVSGKTRWKRRLEAGPVDFTPLSEGRILAIQPKNNQIKLSALSQSTGKTDWNQTFNASGSGLVNLKPVTTLDAIYTFYDGVRRLSLKDGREEWHRGDVRMDSVSPIPRVVDDDLLIIDSKTKLFALNRKTGKTQWSVALNNRDVISNIYPLNKRIYLRGIKDGRSKNGVNFLIAFEAPKGRILWNYNSQDPITSNLLEHKGRLYGATSQNLIAINLRNGRQSFKKKVAPTRSTYPVQIRIFSDKIIFVGELNIAAFNTAKGTMIYSHGFSPVALDANLMQLDNSIARLEKELSYSNKGKGFDWGQSSSYWSSQSRRSQELSNYYYQRASAYRSGYLSKTNLAGMQAQKFELQAQIQSSFSRMEASIALTTATIDLMAKVEEFYRQMLAGMKREIMLRRRVMRTSIISAYPLMESGEYVYRPISDYESTTNEFTSIAIIHLPTGKKQVTPLSPAYRDYGLWTLFDSEKGVAYHQGLGLDSSSYEWKIWGNEEAYGNYLLAQQVKLSKVPAQ